MAKLYTVQPIRTDGLCKIKADSNKKLIKKFEEQIIEDVTDSIQTDVKKTYGQAQARTFRTE